MSGYLAERSLFALITLLFVVTAVFFLLRLAPGGPFDGERALPPEIEANLKAVYHLDAPLHHQYIRYLGRLVQGDLGPSFRQKDFSVNDLIRLGLPTSLRLGLSALVVAVALGMVIGIAAARQPGSAADILLMAVNNISLAIPTIIVAPLLVLVFAVTLSWLPAGGIGSVQHFVLPVTALALPYTAAIARLIRGSMVEAQTQPHITTARAKGLNETRIILRHTLPLAALPVISFLGPTAAGLVTGSVVVEQIFDLPGIGRYFVQGALARDYTLVMGVVVVYSLAILTFNLLVDLTYGWLDPRLRVG